MASNRRIGLEQSKTRALLLDATEAVMREEGYAAVTARRVAERAGVRHQLVYYYFQTMDDLLVAAFRRRAQLVIQQVEEVLAAPRPLHAFWNAFNDPVDAALTLEYLALANHNEQIRIETIEFGEQIRRLEAAQRYGNFKPAGNAEIVTPYALIVSLTYIARLLGFEATLGIRGGHKETRRLVEWALRQFEPSGA